MHRFIKRAPIGLALFGISISSSPSFAQATEATAEPVIVTATRFPERRLDAPIGTRIITAEEIQNSTANTLPEVLQKLGGVHVRNNSGSPDLQLDLRGFGATGDDNTLVLLDGVRIEKLDSATRHLSSIPLQMVERIEILPGSGSVLYGAGATGGTINIITKSAARNQRSMTLSAGAGSHRTREARVIGTVAGEELGLTLSGTQYRSDNYRDNNEVEQTSGVGDLSWQRGDSRASLRFGADRQSLGLPGSRTEAQLKGDRNGTSSPDDHSRIDSAFTTLSAATRVGQFELEGDLGYRDGSNDADFVSFASGYHSDHDTLNMSPRVRWSTSLFDMPLQLVSGLDWYEWDWSSRSTGLFPAASAAEQQSNAFYAQAAADVTSTTRLNVGWRAQRIETEQRNVAPSFPAEVDERRTLYANEIGLRQQLSSAWSAHIKTGRAFRVPNVDENFGFAFTGELLKPQRSKQVEVGVEYSVAGLRASATAYDIKLDNEIAFIVIPPGVFANTNLSPTRRQGVELAADWAPYSTLDTGFRVQWMRATFREGTYGGVDVSGNEVPLVPRWLANAHATWEFIAKTKLSLSYTYVGRQRYENDQANRFASRMPSYDLVDLRLSRQLGDWLLALNVNNILDEEYYSYGVVNGAFTSFTAYPQARRTMFASVEYRFH